MTVSRRAWLAGGVGTLVAGLGSAALWGRFRPMPPPVWERAIGQRGAKLQEVPGRPGLSVCLLSLEIQYGMGGRSQRPALLVRNAGGRTRLDRIEWLAGNTPVRVWFPETSGPAGQWERLRASPQGATLSSRDYTLVLCGEIPPVSPASDVSPVPEPPSAEVTTDRVRLMLDGVFVELESVGVSVVDGQQAGLVPLFYAA